MTRALKYLAGTSPLGPSLFGHPSSFHSKRGHLEKSFYPPIFHDVLEYLKEEGIALHTEALNLRSSQVCCFNFLFALKKDLNRATSMLSDTLPELRKVLSIDFEYTGPSSATEWLGEPRGGKRGLNRTSIDAALWWEDQSEDTRLTLVEWKYTEAAFGSCSASENRPNTCRTLRVQDIRPQEDCYLAKGTDDRLSRRYWEHLEQAGILPERFGDSPGCPFQGPFYQLMRQFLLAEYCRDNLSRTHGVDVKVDVMTIAFRDNRHLLDVPPYLRHLGDDVVSAWNRMLMDEDRSLRIVFVAGARTQR